MRSKIFLISTLLFISQCYAQQGSDSANTWVKKPGYIVLSVPLKLDRLDPTATLNAHSKFTLPLIFEPLITISANQELQPVLAQSWQIASNAKFITINLKPNHHFSDNSKVTASDVVKSIYRLCGSRSHEYKQLSDLEGCQEYAANKSNHPQVFAIGKYTLKFNIKSSPTTFLYELSSPNTVITKNTKTGLIGSGVYFVDEVGSDFIILKKNPYYSDAIKIKNEGLFLYYVGNHDIQQRIASDKSDGAILYKIEDLWGFCNNQYKLIKSNPNITEILVLNNQQFPFNQPIVRRALSTEIYNNFNSTCIPGSHRAYGIIPEGVGGSLSNMSSTQLAALSSQEVLDAVPSLKKTRAPIVIHQLYDNKNDCMANQIKRAGNKYNIDITFQYHKDYSDLLPLYINHHLDAFIDLYIFKNREAYNILEFFTRSGENDPNVKDTNLDKILADAKLASSSHRRFQIYHKAAQYIQDSNVVIPLFYMDHGNLMSNCLTGISEDFVFNPFQELPKISKLNNC